MEQRENGIKQTVLSQQEVQYIQSRLFLREREDALKIELEKFKKRNDLSAAMSAYYEKNIVLIERTILGDNRDKEIVVS